MQSRTRVVRLHEQTTAVTAVATDREVSSVTAFVLAIRTLDSAS